MWYITARTFDGEKLAFDIYDQSDESSDILFVHHGSSRSIYRSGRESIAERESLTIFTPTLPRSTYDSDNCQRGGIVDDRDRLLPDDERTTRLQEPMVDRARDRIGGDGEVYLFGHSRRTISQPRRRL